MRILYYQRNEKFKKGFLPWQQRALVVVLKKAASQYLFLEDFLVDDRDLPQQQLLLGPEDEAVTLNGW